MTDLAEQVTVGDIDLEALHDADDNRVLATLTGLTGVGRWSAEYTLLRGLGRYHVLPGDDVGARNNLRRRFGLTAAADYDAVAELAQAWWPYGGLVFSTSCSTPSPPMATFHPRRSPRSTIRLVRQATPGPVRADGFSRLAPTSYTRPPPGSRRPPSVSRCTRSRPS